MHMIVNRVISSIKIAFYGVLVCSMLCVPHAYSMAFPGMENLSPEEMQQLEQELQAAAQQIDAYVNSLSPEEQAEFQRAVQEVEEMMNSMSPEELEQFFEQIIAQEMEQAQMQQGIQPITTQAPITLEPKATPIVSNIPLTSAEQKALTILTSLIDSTDKILNKANNILDIESRFKNWANNNKLSGVGPMTTWQQQQDVLNEFRVQISDLKKTDLKTGKYLFIEQLIKNNALYSQLEQLSKELEIQEARIVVSKIEKLSDTSKEALRSALNAYGSTLQSAKNDIKKLFEEIAPELAKIKEEEKKTTEKAQAEAGKTRQVTPGRTAGSADRGGYYGGGRGSYDDYGYDGGRSGRDYGYGDYGRQQPGAEKTGKQPEKGKQPKPSGKGASKEDSKFEKDKKGKDKDKKQGGDKAGKTATSEKIVACPVDGGEQLNGKLELIASNYRYIAQLMSENKAAFDFETLLKSTTVNPQYALYLFPTIERRLKRLNELIGEYKKQAEAVKDVTQQNAALEKLVELHGKQEMVNTFFGDLEKTLAQLKTDDADMFIREINADARYAYFKDALTLKKPDEQTPLKSASEKTKQELKLESLSSLSDIFAEWQKLQTSMPSKKKEDKKKDADQAVQKPA